MPNTDQPDYDVIVVGAGFAGIYAIHKFRDQLGLRVHAYDVAADVGGTWYWNRYPGARVDIESVHYSYSFSDELQQEWHWTERYPAQAEILRYLQHVADRFDVRRDISFNTRIVSVTWDEQADLWRVVTDDGRTATARYFVSGAGTLSVPKKPDFPGIETFAGQALLTGNWTEDVDLAGKRIGVIGTGSTGIQVIQDVAKYAGDLTVFQRTPNYITPVGNYPTDPAEEADEKARYAEIREAARNHFLGVPYDEVQPSAKAATPEEREAIFNDRWDRGGLRFFIDSFGDLLVDAESNELAAEFIRAKIREKVTDPEKAAVLTPTDYPYGTKRPPLEIDYYEAFNRDDVHIVDVKANPIDSVVPEGVRLADGTVHPLDVLILATGFDVLTGPLLALNITGRRGLRLADAWAEGPRTYLGLTVHDFPNLFTVTGPQSPSVLYNAPLGIEDHIDYIGRIIGRMREHGHTVVDPTLQAQEQWVTETDAIGAMTLVPETPSSYYMGANIPGKPRKILPYGGGAPRYRAISDNIEQNGYRGFRFAATSGGLDSAGSAPALDPSVAFLVEALKQQGYAGFRDAGVDGTRAVVESFADLQAPKKEVAEISDHAYGPDPAHRLRIYRPEPGATGLPVVVYVHGGGFVGGSLDVADEVARDLAVRTGAVVVSATYRRAPEHRFPAAHDDVYAALRWTAGTIAEHGGDPARIALAGDSAGGNLAAGAALRAVQDAVPLSALLLIYPLVNAAIATPSRERFATGYLIELDDLAWCGEQYVSGADDLADPRLALDTADLAGLPPTFVITNELDTLRDEAELLGKLLTKAGVDATVRRFDGLAHGVYWTSLAVSRSVEQRAAAAEFLVAHLAPARPSAAGAASPV
ncbi:flavin-containing monooxygenase [Actinomadura madurae]|uniref:Predicted flavoprotein CzcO associated with the cation diffusion facilitator CzcD n=1 Tax=Actinomadura madurae TaxID=1993 RepID=A0A1I5PFS8_9ACTN|nr:alpha/beta hydrolase fold domain-containing protein [Actinomadura madurae]SFP32962.1 Predicted flavoprotein CzcO associated with the cation diffusion facilitator CzcD [Actinomadura madurae]SPT63922.1 Phenylacetone monooxygenase [Actinomadura madurae]